MAVVASCQPLLQKRVPRHKPAKGPWNTGKTSKPFLIACGACLVVYSVSNFESPLVLLSELRKTGTANGLLN